MSAVASSVERVDDCLQKLFACWRRHEISDAELVASYIILQSRLRFGNRWLQGKRANSFLTSRDDNKLRSPADRLMELWLPVGEKRLYTLLEFFSTFRIKSMRQGAVNLLTKWMVTSLPLNVFVGPVSSEDILAMQCFGKRCVSVFESPCDWTVDVVYAKPPLEFTLHDLDHAEKFMCDEESYRAQIGFFDCIKSINRNSSILKRLRRDDIEFDRQFVYLISDMNTHCVHQVEYFKATALRSILKIRGISEREILDGVGRVIWNTLSREVSENTGIEMLELMPDDLITCLHRRGVDILARVSPI